MGSKNGKKNSSGTKNPERRCGKAWKKDKGVIPPPKTLERQAKDMQISLERDRRRQDGMARKAVERAQALLEAQRKESEEEASREALPPSMRWMPKQKTQSRPTAVDALLVGM